MKKEKYIIIFRANGPLKNTYLTDKLKNLNYKIKNYPILIIKKIYTKEIKVNNNDVVITDRIIFSNISYEMRNKQNRVFMPYKINTPVTNHFQISSPLKHDRKDNFFLIGSLSDVSYLSKNHHGNLIKEFNVSFSSDPLKLYEVTFK